MPQAKYFTEAVGVTAIILSKLDGTAKGGVVFSVCDQLGVPVRFVGTGERPQDLAGMVVRKAAQMAGHMNVPILGLIENMSYFVCPDTGKQYDIFGPSHAEKI